MRARRTQTLALAVSIAALACAPPVQRRYEQSLETAPPAALHGVHSERLRQVMGSLARLQYERLPQAMDVEEERARRVDEVAKLAREMADSAALIPGGATDAGIDPSARREFDGYAAQLAGRARALAGEAAQLPPHELRQRAQGVVEVCDACHTRFRIPLEPAGG